MATAKFGLPRTITTSANFNGGNDTAWERTRIPMGTPTSASTSTIDSTEGASQSEAINDEDIAATSLMESNTDRDPFGQWMKWGWKRHIREG